MLKRELEITLPDDRAIAHKRVFDAPRTHVYAALSRPDLLARWYGPPGFSLVSCEMDFRVGGNWRFVTRRTDGREIVQYGVYTEIVPPERIVNTERWIDWDVGDVIVTTELTEHGGQTTLTSVQRFPSKEIRDKLVAAGAHRNLREHYDELEAFLATDVRGLRD